MDALPHFAIKVINNDVGSRNRTLLFKRVTTADITLAALSLIVLPFLLRHQVSWHLSLACMLTAMAPDLAWVYRFFGELKTGHLRPKNRFNRFHSSIQRAEFPKGWIIDVIWFLGSVLLVGWLV